MTVGSVVFQGRQPALARMQSSNPSCTCQHTCLTPIPPTRHMRQGEAGHVVLTMRHFGDWPVATLSDLKSVVRVLAEALALVSPFAPKRRNSYPVHACRENDPDASPKHAMAGCSSIRGQTTLPDCNCLCLPIHLRGIPPIFQYHHVK